MGTGNTPTAHRAGADVNHGRRGKSGTIVTIRSKGPQPVVDERNVSDRLSCGGRAIPVRSHNTRTTGSVPALALLVLVLDGQRPNLSRASTQPCDTHAALNALAYWL